MPLDGPRNDWWLRGFVDAYVSWFRERGMEPDRIGQMIPEVTELLSDLRYESGREAGRRMAEEIGELLRERRRDPLGAGEAEGARAGPFKRTGS